MSKRKKHKNGEKGKNKTWASKRTANPSPGPGHRDDTPAPGEGQGGFQEHDAQNRLGSFETQGEHARTGNPGHE